MLRLSGLEDEFAGGAAVDVAGVVQLFFRYAFQKYLPAHDREFDAVVDGRVPDDGLGVIVGFLDQLHIRKVLIPDHVDALVAFAEGLFGPVGEGALADPGDEILVHDVGADPAACLRIGQRRRPGGDAVLNIGLPALGDPVEEPADAERVLVINRHAPFEVVPVNRQLGQRQQRPTVQRGWSSLVSSRMRRYLKP